MPRVKTVPIKRTAHRFESSTTQHAVAPSNDAVNDDNDFLLQDINGEEESSHPSPNVIDHTDSSQSTEESFQTFECPIEVWTQTSHKRKDKRMLSLSSIQYSFDPGQSILMSERTVLIDRSSLGMVTDKVALCWNGSKGLFISCNKNDSPNPDGILFMCEYPTSQLRLLYQAVQEKTLQIVAEGKVNKVIISTYLLLPQEKQENIPLVLNIHPAVLDWCLRPQYAHQSWAAALTSKDQAPQAINGEDFLQRLSHSIAGQYTTEEKAILQEILRKMGVITELRPYQLEGVLWMHHTLTKTQQHDNQQMGCLPITFADQLHASLLWEYNLITQTLHSIRPKSDNSAATEMIDGADAALVSSNSEGGGCILADEMGIGKSLEILSLILWFHYQSLSVDNNNNNSICNNISPSSPPRITEAEFNVMVVFLQMHFSEVSEYKGLRNRHHQPDHFFYSLAEETVEMQDTACFCGRKDTTVKDLGWMECMACKKWRHIGCEQFSSAEEADACVHYLCHPCQTLYYYHHPKLPSHPITLLILPNTLLHQWQHEIRKHCPPQHHQNPASESTPSLKILEYDYLDGPHSKAKITSSVPASPHYPIQLLANQDIIIMSFSTLKKCYHMAQIPWKEYKPSQERSDLFPPSIFGLQFHLIVIDETQNLENKGTNNSNAIHPSQVFTMACQLTAKHRITVSGTPMVNHQILDFFPLIQFLRLKPWHDHPKLFQDIIATADGMLPISPATRLEWLVSYFQQRLLRRTKAIVKDQLGLADSIVVIRKLTFSPFEVSILCY